MRAGDRIRLAIDVADPAFADRIASVLADVEGLELVSKDDEPDALVVAALGTATEVETNIALTARELEVLALLAEGASNKLIARRLGISAHTAKYHVASLLEKLDAVSRTDAVAHAARIGVLHL
jgi:DNA-binding CsgD family transcriptional regulator